MGDLRNKARRWAEEDARADKERRKRLGWTLFHFDFKPNLTRRDLMVGEAIRYLLRSTGSRMFFRMCQVRGMYVEIKRLPTTGKSYDHGYSYVVLNYSTRENVVDAKKELAIDTLLNGIDLFRGLPNAVYDDQIETIKWLLRAPPSVTAEEWTRVLEKVHAKTRPLFRTHESELRHHLLGERYTGPAGSVAMTARVRMEALEKMSPAAERPPGSYAP